MAFTLQNVNNYCYSETKQIVFQVTIKESQKNQSIWKTSLTFQIKLYIKDIALLNEIKQTLDIGSVTIHSKNTANFNMYSIREMQVLVYHFVKYPLITTKYSDFLLFKQAFEIIKTKGHLTEKGLLEIVRIKSILNLGLSDKLKTAFPNFVPVSRDAKGKQFLNLLDSNDNIIELSYIKDGL